MERYSRHDEQTFRNNFERWGPKGVNWLQLNAVLARSYFGETGRWAVAVDPSYISKSGKKTPHIGRFWSGYAQAVRHGLEIMGIDLVDIDSIVFSFLLKHVIITAILFILFLLKS